MNVIQENCNAFLDIMLDIKLLYQQDRIRKYRLKLTNPSRILGEAGHAPQERRKQRERSYGQSGRKGLPAVDTDEHLGHT